MKDYLKVLTEQKGNIKKEALKQAIVLKEVFGAPKALQKKEVSNGARNHR